MALLTMVSSHGDSLYRFNKKVVEVNRQGWRWMAKLGGKRSVLYDWNRTKMGKAYVSPYDMVLTAQQLQVLDRPWIHVQRARRTEEEASGSADI